MAVDAASLRDRRPASALLTRLRTAPAWIALGALVVVSSAVRIGTALAHPTPRYFPDEYIYSELARSISRGTLTVRGAPAHFPALLEPLLAAPLWLTGNVETAYRLTQCLHAIGMSLAAVPVFLLARRLGLPRWQQLASAALTLALPGMVFSAYDTADAIGLTLALSAVCAGMVALETPSRRSQVVFLVFAGLAVFARVQYVVIPLAFLVAALVVAHGRPMSAARRYAIVVSTIGAAAFLALVVGSGRTLGYYHGVLHLHAGPAAVVRWIGTDLVLLGYAAGLVLVPAALAGLWFTFRRDATAAERAFGALVAALIALLLLEAGIYAATGTARFQERYLEAVLPLVPLLFFLGVRHETTKRQRLVLAAASIAVVALGVRTPLGRFAVDEGRQDSPFLQAVYQLEQRAHVAASSRLPAIVAALLLVVALAALLCPRHGGAVACGIALALAVGTAAAAVSFDLDHARLARNTFLPTDPRWVDHSAMGDVSVLVTRNAVRAGVSEQLFWNRRLTRLLQLPGSQQVDSFGAATTTIGDDGSIVADGRALVGPLLVEEYADRAELTGARLVQRTLDTALWRPAGTPRIVSLTSGRYFDGWFGQPTEVGVWPAAAHATSGVICLRFALPPNASTTLRLEGPGTHVRARIAGGVVTRVAVPVRSGAPFVLRITAERPGFTADGRAVAAFGAPPHFVAGKASSSACR
jgi:hypothetical protein